MEKIIIAAFDDDQAIGKDNEIPWHYPEDLKHFKEKTTGHPVLMGRKTYLSLPENFKPLPNRTNIVLTNSDPELEESVKIVNSLDEAYSEAEKYGDSLFIAGGASVYEQTLSDADKMILTLIPGKHEGDTFFPDWNEEEWEETSRNTVEELTFVELDCRS